MAFLSGYNGYRIGMNQNEIEEGDYNMYCFFIVIWPLTLIIGILFLPKHVGKLLGSHQFEKVKKEREILAERNEIMKEIQ